MLNIISVNSCVFVANSLCLSAFVAMRQFMQNKPNFLKNRPNVTSCKSKGYENEHRFLAQKSQSQFPKRQNERNISPYNELPITSYESPI